MMAADDAVGMASITSASKNERIERLMRMMYFSWLEKPAWI